MKISALKAKYESKKKPSPKSLLNLEAEVAEVYVYGVLGWEVLPRDFAKALDDAKAAGAKELRLYVSSPGGDIFDTKAMVANLQRFPGRTVAIVDGLAASAASWLAIAANEVRMHPESEMMIHRASAIAWGTGDDMRAMAALLDQEDESILRMYAAKAGDKCTPERLKELVDAETFLPAAEAKRIGLCDVIIGADEEEQQEEPEEPEEPEDRTQRPEFFASAERTQRLVAEAIRIDRARKSLRRASPS